MFAAGSGSLPPLSYTHDGSQVTITDCDSAYEGELLVPAIIEGLPVVLIGESAFEDCRDLSRVVLPDSVEQIEADGFNGCLKLASIALPANLQSIGAGAFRDCRQLSALVLPAGVTIIGERAFERCISLQSITLSASLTGIGDFAFKNCVELDAITLPSSLNSLGVGAFSACAQLQAIGLDEPNNQFSVIDGVLFDQAVGTLLSFPAGRDGAYTVPEGVTTIRAWAFSDSLYIDQIHLPSSLTALEEGAFNACRELITMEIPAGVTALPDFTFQGCQSLQTLTIPDSVLDIEPGALRFMPALRHLEVAATNPRYASRAGVLLDESQKSFVKYPAQRPGTGYAIPQGFTGIADYAFEDSLYLQTVRLPDGLTAIGFASFSDCYRLEAIALPYSLADIAASAFTDCPLLEAVYFLGSAPTIAPGAFTRSPAAIAYFFEGASGFAAPVWTYESNFNNSIAAVELPAASRTPFLEWRLRSGYRHDSSPEDPARAFSSILGEYALGLGLAGTASPPSSETLGENFALRFFAGRSDVAYTVLSSDLRSDWTSDPVSLSPIDADGYRTASIPLADQGFMRIAFAHQP